MPPTDPSPDIVLTPINGQGRTVEEWLTTFHLLLLVLDPYTNESAWVFPVAQRVAKTFSEADVRVAWLVTADAADARRFLGPWADDFLTFADPDRTAVKGLGLERLPAIVHLGIDGRLAAAAQGWNPETWRRVTEPLAVTMRWTEPVLGMPQDPGPFEGSPALS